MPSGAYFSADCYIKPDWGRYLSCLEPDLRRSVEAGSTLVFGAWLGWRQCQRPELEKSNYPVWGQILTARFVQRLILLGNYLSNEWLVTIL